LAGFTVDLQLSWVDQTYSPDVRSVGLDADNDVFPFGRFRETGYFVARYTSTGKQVWSDALAGTDERSTGVIAVHSSGALTRARVVDVNGRLSWQIDGMNESANTEWTAFSGCPSDRNETVHVQVDEADNVYVIGSAACRLPSELATGAVDWSRLPVAGLRPGALLIQKLDSKGTPQWAKQVCSVTAPTLWRPRLIAKGCS
jgi:hypothetical protein